MLVEVKVPVLAESISEATLVNWNKQPGEYVQRNENLVDMETDKVMLEIVAPNDGVLKEIVKGDGETVSSNDVIAVIDTDATHVAKPQAKTAATVKNIREASAAKSSHAAVKPAALSSMPATEMPLSPAVRKLVADNRLDPHLIKGSGKMDAL